MSSARLSSAYALTYLLVLVPPAIGLGQLKKNRSRLDYCVTIAFGASVLKITIRE